MDRSNKMKFVLILRRKISHMNFRLLVKNEAKEASDRIKWKQQECIKIQV